MIRSLLLLCLIGLLQTSPLSAQFPVKAVNQGGIIGVYLPPNPVPAIEFDSREDWLLLHEKEFRIKGGFGSYKIKSKTEATLRISPEGPTLSNEDNRVILRGNFRMDEGRSLPFEMTFEAIDRGKGVSLDFDLLGPPDLPYSVELRYLDRGNSRKLGFGEQFSHVDWQGKESLLLVEENGIGRGDKPGTGIAKLVGAAGSEFATYCPIPFYLDTKGSAVLVEGDFPVQFDFKEEELAKVEILSPDLKMKIWLDKDPRELIRLYTAHTGRFPLLPDWTWGTWLGLQGGAEKVERIVSDAQSAGNPVSALWIQDWVGKRKTVIGSRLWWEWKANEEVYPDFNNFVRELNEKEVRVLGYINSFLAAGTPMAEEAKSKRLLFENPDQSPYLLPAGGFDAYLLNLSKGATQDWLKKILRENMMEAGLSGWMADFGEWVPLDQSLRPGDPQLALHNRYPREWLRLNREAVEEAGREDEVVFFNRSGWTGSNQYAMSFWTGDQLTNFGEHDGMKSAITALISSGLSGIAINHTDIGGYTNLSLPGSKVHRDRETLSRWIEFAAFTPIFRTHEGLQPEKNVQVYSDPEMIDFFARFGRIHASLKPYLKLLNKEAAESGLPMVRHLHLHYPADQKVFAYPWQYLLGEALLIAPAIEKSQKTQKVYLPFGTWTHAFSGEEYQGEQEIEVDCPIGWPAVFVAGNKTLGWEPGLDNFMEVVKRETEGK